MGGADVETSRARSAAVGLERRVRLQLEIEQQRTDEEVGADLGIDQVGVLAEPAEPGFACEVALEDWASVYVSLARDLT